MSRMQTGEHDLAGLHRLPLSLRLRMRLPHVSRKALENVLFVLFLLAVVGWVGKQAYEARCAQPGRVCGLGR